jgi:hypothetical protein
MLVRCQDHPSEAYAHEVAPIGYPETAAICGRCEKAGKVLLNEKEWRQYQAGRTVFAFNSNVMRVRVKSAIH